MKTCQDVINRAARKLNLIQIGSALGTAESAEALTVLQSLYMELVGVGTFGRENDCLSCGDWTVLPQQRVRMDDVLATATIPDIVPSSIYWPDWWAWPYDNYNCWPIWPVFGAGCQAPRDLSIVTVVDPTNNLAVTYLYDAFVGKWAPISALVLAAEAPLSRRWFEPLANVLAGRLSADYGSELTAGLQLAIRNGLAPVALKFGNASPPVSSVYF